MHFRHKDIILHPIFIHDYKKFPLNKSINLIEFINKFICYYYYYVSNECKIFNFLLLLSYFYSNLLLKDRKEK